MSIQLNTPQQLSAAKQLRRELLGQQLLGTMGNDAMLGLGIGGTAVGLTSLLKLLSSMSQKRTSTQTAPVLRVEDKRKRELTKQSAIKSILEDAATGRAATDVNSLPFGLPMRTLALLLGAGGGAYLTNKALTKVKHHTLDQELEQAKAEYEAALSARGSRPNMKLAAALDRLENAIEQSQDDKLKSLDKQAADALANGLGQVMGLYALMAMLGGGTAAYYGYKSGLKNQQARKYELADAARKQRQRKLDPARPVAVLSEDPEDATTV